MIAYLSGKVKRKTTKYLIIEAGSIGYRVFVSPGVIEEAILNKPIELFTSQYVSESASELYGFKTTEELDLFELLINISGVGPKSALSILSMAPVKDITLAILNDDPAILTKVSGIGRKTAERIIVELKSPLEKTGLSAGEVSQDFIDALEALIQLGYPRAEARRVLNQIKEPNLDSQDRVKTALKILGNKQ